MAGQIDTMQLLAALQKADEAGDTEGAKQIAAMIHNGVDPTPAPVIVPKKQENPQTQGGGSGPIGGSSALDTMLGTPDAMAAVGSSMLAQPVAGIAGLGAMAAKGMGLTNKEPADIVSGVQNAMTYRPRTQQGQATISTLGDVAGVIPKAGDAVGQGVANATGSPAAGAIANAGLQGTGMILGGELGNIAGAAGRGATSIPGVRPAMNFASDMLPGGANRAATRIIRGAAGDDGSALGSIQNHVDAQNALRAAGQSGDLASKYGIRPTTAQVANNAGLAQLDRTLRNQGADVSRPLTNADANNSTALQNILEDKAGTPESRDSLGRLRDTAAKASYQAATTAPEHAGVIPPGMDARSFANELAAKHGVGQDGFPSSNDPAASPEGLNDAGVRLQSLLQRPAMQDAMGNAGRQAANRGVSIDSSNLIQQLHYAKLYLDGKISAAMRSGDSTELGGLMDTKNELGQVMDKLSPTYAAAREQFQQLSQPINRADVAEALRQKYMSGLTDQGGVGASPSRFADALRQPAADQLAQRATGFSGARMDKIMSPQDMADYQAAAEQMARQQRAQQMGRAVGSPTAQNLTGQRALDNIGSPKAFSEDLGPAVNLAATIAHPAIAIGSAVRGSGVRSAAAQRLGQMMADPEMAAQALAQKYKQPTIMPHGIGPAMAVGATSDQPQMADGGAVDYKKSSIWDLLTQAIKEATGPSNTEPAAPAADPGATASGSVGRSFDNRVDQAVADQGG